MYRKMPWVVEIEVSHTMHSISHRLFYDSEESARAAYDAAQIVFTSAIKRENDLPALTEFTDSINGRVTLPTRDISAVRIHNREWGEHEEARIADEALERGLKIKAQNKLDVGASVE